MFTACLFLVFQSAASSFPARAPSLYSERRAIVLSAWEDEQDLKPVDPDAELRMRGAYEEREFVKRLNTLLGVLHDFAASYNAGKVDVKKAKEVRKALHDLEKSEWFRTAKPETR
jgi:hypothetical protein